MHPATRIEQCESTPSLFCKLHPAAEEFEFSVISPRQLVVEANTTTVGPGYHVFLCGLLEDLAREIGVTWDVPSDDSADFGDETGFFLTGDVDLLRTEMTTWLAAVANTCVRDQLETVALCMPWNPNFQSDERAITPLGPRNDEWLRRTAAGGGQGTDFFSWWEPGFSAQYYLGRALTQMWTDVRWRAPVNSREELVLGDVLNCLTTAHELDPGLDYPWAEWHEMHGFLGTRLKVEDFRAKLPATPKIGYRRRNVTATMPGGWLMTVPGSFTDFEAEQGGDLSAIDPPREIWFTAYELEDRTSKGFKVRKKSLREDDSDEVIEGTDYFSQCKITLKRRPSGESYFVLNSSNLTIGARCVCTIVFPSPSERAWALDTWRSLKHPSVG